MAVLHGQVTSIVWDEPGISMEASCIIGGQWQTVEFHCEKCGLQISPYLADYTTMCGLCSMPPASYEFSWTNPSYVTVTSYTSNTSGACATDSTGP